jgi:ATP-dependent DNA helicase PIF1
MNIEEIIPLIETGENLFISGGAGTGKTHLLKLIYAHYKKNKNIDITSTTGVTAISLGGRTIHSWSSIGFGKQPANVIINNIKKYKNSLNRIKQCDILLIDEISMLGKRIFELINEVVCAIRKQNNFGGIQLIVSGDFLQLPPVKDFFVFESDKWESLNFKIISLSFPHRFTDSRFYSLLKRARVGKLNKDDRKILESRTISFNEQNPIKPTIIHSLNYDVEEENERELTKLTTPLKSFQAFDSFNILSKKTKMPFHPTEKQLQQFNNILEQMARNIARFKIGAQVMLTYNFDIEHGLANGSRGVIVDIDINNNITVLFKCGKIQIPVYGFLTTTIITDSKGEEQKIELTRWQFPLILAWSSTIHKIQGSTLDCALIDLGESIFSPAMGYVALSRVRTIDSLYLSSFDSSKIYANKFCVEYEDKHNFFKHNLGTIMNKCKDLELFDVNVFKLVYTF